MSEVNTNNVTTSSPDYNDCWLPETVARKIDNHWVGSSRVETHPRHFTPADLNKVLYEKGYIQGVPMDWYVSQKGVDQKMVISLKGHTPWGKPFTQMYLTFKLITDLATEYGFTFVKGN